MIDFRFTIYDFRLVMEGMKDILKKRTKRIGVEIILLTDLLPSKSSASVLAKQILRSSTSIGANYRAVCRAKSTADFINKLKIVEEETDETIYWLKVLEESGLLTTQQTATLKKEAEEILSIIVASINTARKKLSVPKSSI